MNIFGEKKIQNRKDDILVHRFFEQAFSGFNFIDGAAVGRDGVTDTGAF